MKQYPIQVIIKNKIKVRSYPRKAYRRGRKGNPRKKDSKVTDHIQIASAIDRSGNVYLRVAKIGTTTLSIEELKESYSKCLAKATVLCTDGLTAYRKLSKHCGVKHYGFNNNSKEKRGIYHINHINYVHSVIRDYFYRHHGISSKYLNEYLALIAYNLQHKIQNLHDNFVNIFGYQCDFRRVNYIGAPFITDSISLG